MKPRTELYSIELAKLRDWRYAHTKRDGHYLEVFKGADGQLYAFTSRPKNIIDQLREFPQFKNWRELPPGSIFQGELWQPDVAAADIKTQINLRSPLLRFDVFGVRAIAGVSAASLDKWALETVREYAAEYGFAFVPFQKLRSSFEAAALDLKTLPAHVEGYVLKHSNQLQWAKMKPRPTIDLIISGWQPGEGKYAGLVGSLTVSTFEGFEVAHVGGMTDEVRAALSRNVEMLKGQVIEVAYQEMGTQGRLRHPSFVRFREDKPPERCTIDQDDDLQNFYANKVQQRKLF